MDIGRKLSEANICYFYNRLLKYPKENNYFAFKTKNVQKI